MSRGLRVDMKTVSFTKLPSTLAWKLTSELVRKESNGVCYTCRREYPYPKLVAGHFLEKRGNAATYFHLDGLRAQCQWYCNRKRHGAKEIYAIYLIKEIGMKRVETLRKIAQKSKVWTKEELESIVEDRKRKLANLL